jgi:hypothetical protein
MKVKARDTLADSMLAYSDRRLKRKVRACRHSFQGAFTEVRPGKRRFAHYQYLQCVYSLYSGIARKKVSVKRRRHGLGGYASYQLNGILIWSERLSTPPRPNLTPRPPVAGARPYGTAGGNGRGGPICRGSCGLMVGLRAAHRPLHRGNGRGKRRKRHDVTDPKTSLFEARVCRSP